MRLLADKILVLRDSSENKLESGIIIPEQSVQKKNTGKIIAVGPGTPNSPVNVSVGEKVSFNPHAGSSVEIEGVEHLIMRVTEIQYII